MSYILIIEDEDFLSRVLTDNLTADGYAVDVAPDSDRAFGFLKDKKPDIIILDLVLPLKSGFRILEELKKSQDWRNIPVIVLSNLGGIEDVAHAMELGADEYLVKSHSTIFEVLGIVKEFIAGTRKRRSNF